MNQPTPIGLRAAGPFTSNQEGSFAWTVLAQRHPVLIEQVRRANPTVRGNSPAWTPCTKGSPR
jgi:hypothetical protein